MALVENKRNDEKQISRKTKVNRFKITNERLSLLNNNSNQQTFFTIQQVMTNMYKGKKV